MALRIKNQWFDSGRPKTAQENASAIAFIIWRVTQNMLKQMREAKFDIDVGPQYFAFMHEVLVFLIQAVDRMAFERMTPEQRLDFTTAMVRRVAEILEESELEWLPPPAAGEESRRNRFIDLCNEQADAYAEFGHGPQGPDFAFVRYLGSRVEAVLPEKDRHWVKDQMMAYEVPEALEMVRRGLDGVLSTEPRPKRRSSMSGE
jgi:hypothetical protein